MRTVLVAMLFVLSSSSAFSQESLLKGFSDQMSQNEAAAGMSEKMTTFADKFKALAISEGISGETEACKTVCSVSCNWVDGKCQPVTTCSLQCDF